MKRLLVLAPLALLLTACTSPGIDDARANCDTTYEHLLTAPSSPCDAWIDSQGEDEFVRFWTTPAEYLPFAMNAAKVDALKEAGLGD